MNLDKAGTWICYIAGILNIFGVLWLTRGGTQIHLSPNVPVFIQGVGLPGIILWGLAYMAIAHTWRSVPHLLCVFALEKSVYAIGGFMWLMKMPVNPFDYALQNPFEGGFLLVYGLNDALFMLLFLILFYLSCAWHKNRII